MINFYHKVAVLRHSHGKCTFEDLGHEIPIDSGPGGAALSMDGDSKLLACFEKDQPSKQCIIILESAPFYSQVESTSYSHYWGRLALWKDQPTTVGGDVDFKKVETYKDGKWIELPDQPKFVLDFYSCFLLTLKKLFWTLSNWTS